MVVISEITDDDNGDKKSPQELPGGETRIITTTRRCSLESVPLDVTECIVASFSRCEYPAISLVSSHFPLRPRTLSLRLARVPSSRAPALAYPLPNQQQRFFPAAQSRLPPSRPLRMRRRGYRASAGVIDGKIFVMGGCEPPSADWVEAFDLERRVWLRWTWPMVSNVRIDFVTYAVVKQRIYTLSPRAWCHAYDPRERTLETWAGGHELRGLWQASSCVVDGMLFNVDPGRSLGHLILVFDLKKQVWRPVKLKGAHGLPPCVYQYGYESRMGSVGGKLVILVGNQTQWWDYEGEKSIWCVEIGLRRRQGGEIRGKVESVDVVFKTTKSTPSIELSRTVIV
ncbi:hypothetical protein BRARA_C04009 [Brassica rapa]|uniref:FKB95-like N-terminal Kelch domain-containing protein n=1 Tax=Brassica campestris TaxID=3711 RepID=A0A398AA01_BRACM|nr:hypothetical protein BRARA_C04009 [Brassica rapa]